eukprot:6313631-Alexandrium_andersonii.AAC.1
MSASLVGSEMCIRDRCCAMWGLAQRRAKMRCASRVAVCQQLSCQQLADAVSYTHLTLPTICSV